MQILASSLQGNWLIDESASRPLGQIDHFIIDPNKLRVIYAVIRHPQAKECSYARYDQLQWRQQVILIRSTNLLGEADDFIRDKSLIEDNCNLINWKVINADKRPQGRVIDYAFTDKSLDIERIIVSPTLIQRLTLPQRILSRQSIREVLPKSKTIIIKQSNQKIRARGTEPVPA